MWMSRDSFSRRNRSVRRADSFLCVTHHLPNLVGRAAELSQPQYNIRSTSAVGMAGRSAATQAPALAAFSLLDPKRSASAPLHSLDRPA